MRPFAFLAALCACACAAEPVEFNRDIRPILSDLCFQCHGPDPKQRKGDLRLDLEKAVFADRGGWKAVEPGKPDKSELLRRLTADDEERMPPKGSARTATAQEIELVKRWIEQGAGWQQHWALVAPVRRQPPTVAGSTHPIDRFLAGRLKAAGLAPNPPAEAATLIRRVTLDLTGLPPTPEEVDAFLADPSPAAFERVVDRLLASHRFGERMSIRWIDAARYADTSGYQSDGERDMWRWRDWVIEAFNANMPFDRFTVEQIAGDLMPNPTLSRRIATGFNRNHRGNAEGGIVPEEYAVEYVADRVETTATVFLGLTFTCCRCHDHKYDPFTQRDFYKLYAFFNNVPERGRAIKYGNSPPYIAAPTPIQQQKLDALNARLAEAEKAFAALAPRIRTEQGQWEKSAPNAPIHWTLTRNLEARWMPGAAAAPTKPIDKLPLNAGDVGDFGFYDKFTLAMRIEENAGDGTLLSRMADNDRSEGYSLAMRKGHVEANFVKRWLDDSLRVRTAAPLPKGPHHVSVVYDGSRTAAGVHIYVDGLAVKTEVILDELNQTFQTKQPLRLGAGGGGADPFPGKLSDVRIYRDALSPVEALIISVGTDRVDDLVRIHLTKRTPAQLAAVDEHFLTHGPADIRDAYASFVKLRRERAAMVESFPTVMVMEELPTPRDAFILKRGEYDKPGEKVLPGVPGALPDMPANLPRNRLGLAQWLVDPRNPLVARVAVNRFWQMLFGTGLVKTSEDFGSQGEWPSHPELLDWLATEFVGNGWNVKGILRTMVLSDAYRRSSRATGDQLARDPQNRMLARGPRLRLPAEMIRDQALAASGLLVERVGGPSVKPYQPAGLWEELSGTAYVQDHGDALYRRGLYVFWKRTAAPPVMVAFDAAGREVCSVRETRTNTPLQALALMNETAFVEASRALAQRAMKTAGGESGVGSRESGVDDDARLIRLFRLVLARSPSDRELAVLRRSLLGHRAEFARDPAAAGKLIAVGESQADPALNPVELAAFTAVANLVLNLDEAVTRE